MRRKGRLNSEPVHGHIIRLRGRSLQRIFSVNARFQVRNKLLHRKILCQMSIVYFTILNKRGTSERGILHKHRVLKSLTKHFLCGEQLIKSQEFSLRKTDLHWTVSSLYLGNQHTHTHIDSEMHF